MLPGGERALREPKPRGEGRPRGREEERMFGKGTHNERGHKSAAEYRQTADEHVQTLKDFWKEFLVSGLFVLAALVIILACLAWFAANNKVNAIGSSISAKGSRYALLPNYDNGNVGVYDKHDAAKNLDTVDAMLVNGDSNFNNTASGGQIYPGSSGKFELKVKPMVKDLGNMTVTISMDEVLKTGLTESDKAQFDKYLSAHIQFFASCDSDGYYGTLETANGQTITVSNQTVSIPSSAFEDGEGKTTQDVSFTVYWVWPEYFRNLIATGGSRYDKNLFKSDSSDYEAFLGMLNKNKGGFFKETSGLPATINNSLDNAQYTNCTNQYNAVDDYLGSNVTYVQVRFAAEETPASSSATEGN